MEKLLNAIGKMTFGEIAQNAALIIVIISVFIEITPIKINPISSLLSWLGGKINVKLIERIDAQEKKLDQINTTIDQNEIDRIRWEILNFSNSCRKDERHSKEEFEHIIKLHEKYQIIIEARHMKNGLIDVEYQYIEGLYRKCLEKNSFI